MSSASFKVGLRALALLAISIVSFALQHHVPIPNGDIEQAAAPGLLVKSVGSAHYTATHSAKRVAVPFGDPAYVISKIVSKEPFANFRPVRRDDDEQPTLTLEQAICIGERRRDQIAKGGTAGRVWTMDDLDPNGWEEYEPDPFLPLAEVQDALRNYGLPTTEDDDAMVHRNFGQLHEFVNPRGETKKALGVYDTIFNVEAGAILILSMFSPAALAQKGGRLPPDELALIIPAFQRWSDVSWVLWKDTAKEKAGTLQYIFHDNIITTNTKYIMERVAGMPDVPESRNNLRVKCCDYSYDVSTKEGAALLGTVHGTGATFMQLDHLEELGGRHNQITMYTAEDPGNENKLKYFLIFEMLLH